MQFIATLSERCNLLHRAAFIQAGFKVEHVAKLRPNLVIISKDNPTDYDLSNLKEHAFIVQVRPSEKLRLV
jgi:hypothetical protein